MIALLLSHPFFAISRITVTGTERLSKEHVVRGLQSYLDGSFALRIPIKRHAYLLVNVEDLRTWLIETFALEDARVEKHFPSRLSVRVTERLSNAILDDGVSYRFLGQDGVPLEVIRPVEESEWHVETVHTTTTLADGTVRDTIELVSRAHEPNIDDVRERRGNYPVIVYNTQTSPTSTASELPYVATELVSRTIEWFEFLTKKTTVPFLYVKKNAQSGPYASIMTREGWEIFISLKEPVSSVAPRFTALLEKKNIERTRLHYIDVRYPGVVYWQ